MKKLSLILLVIIFCFGLSAKEFIPPAKGNAVVCIVRTTSFGSAHNFRFFHNENFVGVFKGKGYMRYELPAGKQLLWAASENKQFLDCDLKPGGTYIVSAMHSVGVVKNPVVLTPVSVTDSNFEKCKQVVLKNKEITTSDKKKAQVEEMIADNDFVNSVLKQYKENKFEKQTKKVAAEMAIPLGKLQ